MEDLKTWLVKILLPSLVAVSIKLALQSKKGAISWFSVITSFVTGIGSAYLFSDMVISTFSHQYIPIAIAIITISGEKIGFYFVYKLNLEDFLEAYISGILNSIRKK